MPTLNTLTLTTHIDEGDLLSYSLEGDIIDDEFESCGEVKKDIFSVGEFAFDKSKIEKAAQWYIDNFKGVTVQHVTTKGI
jgi:hypothetical protein